MSRYPYREIIEMRSVGISLAKTSFLCGCSIGKTEEVTANASRLGLGWPVPIELSDDELEQLVDPIEHDRKAPPDFPAIAEAMGGELKLKNADEAYSVYLDMCQSRFLEPYAESSFRARLSGWIASSRARVRMRINWHPGEEIQVDWAGSTLSLYGDEGKVTPVYLFVATSPYSDLTFVRASLDMGMQTWLEHHRAMFEFFGGAPIFLAIDNLATGVVFSGGDRFGRAVNPSYQGLADHYGSIVVPARVKVPTDKAAVEGHVRIMAGRIVNVLEQLRFTTLSQMNAAIAELMEVFNARPMGTLGRSRREIYNTEELECMQPLPAMPFEAVTWKKHKVSRDGVVRVRGNYYAVPGRWSGARVQAKIAVDTVEIWNMARTQCIAIHTRGEDGSQTFEGLPGVSPDRFRKLDDWAAANGRELILRQWDDDANGGLSPGGIVCRSKKAVHWKCPDCGHRWEEAVVRRTSRAFDDCPACSGIALLPGVNDLETVCPEVAAEWDCERNHLKPDEVFPDWTQTVWWKGECGHAWRAPISERVYSHRGRLCPVCSGEQVLEGYNDIATVCPELAEHWHPTKNHGMTPANTPVNVDLEVYLWDGPLSRIWRQTPRSWMKEHGFAGAVEPFEMRLSEARAKDAGAGCVRTPSDAMGRERATLRWQWFLSAVGLRMTLRQWCEATGRDDLVAEWDGERNGDLTPDNVTRASLKSVWWRGECGHVWQEKVRSRTVDDAGCKYCGRVRVLEGYSSIEASEARLLGQWHPTRNGGLTPSEVSDRSHQPIWWQCPECGYEWQEPMRRTNRMSRRCPACNRRDGYLIPGRNDLASRRDMAKIVDGELNGAFDPGREFRKTKREIWWRGECGHVWLQRIDLVGGVKKGKCPYCSNRRLLKGFNDLATRSPDAASMWDAERNGGLAPADVRCNESRSAWWRCERGHSWEAPVAYMASGAGCPYCSGHRVLSGFNDLASKRPDLAAQWDWERNGDLAPDAVTCGSNKRVWWRCEQGHSWQLSVANRTCHDAGCPVCSGRVALSGFNDIATTHPEIAVQWDGANAVPATEVTARSSMRARWRCDLGHTWEAQVSRRCGGHDAGCPYCGGRKVWPGYNDLATVRPDVAAEWHPHMNRALKPADVLSTSSKEVWWHGGCGHTWKAKVGDRTAAKHPGCPYCKGTRVPEVRVGASGVEGGGNRSRDSVQKRLNRS